MSEALTTVLTKIVEILTPLGAEERKRVVHAAFALIGDPVPTVGVASGHVQAAVGPASDFSGISPSAAGWLVKAKISREQLEHCFHFDGEKVKVIALPGAATKRIDQVINAYLMQGFASFLQSGDSSFTDQEARELCDHFGCYDQTNHAKYLKEFGNRLTGAKNSGWKLTAPGMTVVGELIKAYPGV